MRATLNPVARGFDLQHAVIFANLSLLAYRGDEEIAQKAREMGGSFWTVEAANHFCFLLGDASNAVIAFRGTNDIKDWVTNVNLRPRAGPWGRVHAGFMGGVEALWPKVIEAIEKLGEAKPAIWLTGHSLGGGIATLLAAQLTIEEVAEVSGVYTFGQPRVGTPAFCREFDRHLGSRLFRFVSCRDEVPNQPPGYLHVGQLKYLDRKGKLHDRPGVFYTLTDGMLRKNRGLRGEHVMSEYVSLVEGLFLEDGRSQS